MIDEHPQGSCQGEILWPHYRAETSRPIDSFLDEHVLGAVSIAKGFKCPYEHLFEIDGVMAYLRQRSFRVLRLIRRNKLDQYLSMRLAQVNGIWKSTKGRYQQHRIELDADHFLRVAAGFQGADRRLKASCAGFVHHSVAYEDLLEGSGWFPVCDFLEITREHVLSPFQRQRELPQHEAILNYQELKERCRGTFAEPFFLA